MSNHLGTAIQANKTLAEAGYHAPYFPVTVHDGTETRIIDSFQIGEEKQHFEIDFAFSQQQVQVVMCRAYLLTVPVTYTIHNGIDTAKLDEQMKQIDWTNDYNGGYYDKLDESAREPLFRIIQGVYDDLNQLSNHSKDPEGMRLAYQFAVKHWAWTPEEYRNLHLQEEREKYTVSKDYRRIPTIKEVHQDLTLRSQQKEEDMHTGINFYELKTHLADLGFTDPELVEQLRQPMSVGDSPSSLTLSKVINEEQLHINIAIDKFESGWLDISGYELAMVPVADQQQVRQQIFQSDVPFDHALQLLVQRTNQPEPDEIRTLTPMTPAQVNNELTEPVNYELTIDPRVTDHLDDYDMAPVINFHELKTQLAALGFNAPTLVDALSESVLNAQYAVISAGYKEQIDDHQFTGWFEFHRDQESGQYELEQYQAMLYNADGKAVDMMLASDITKAEALQVLRTEFARKEPDLTLYWPMTRQTMQTYFETINNKQMNTKNLESLQKSLLNLGFGDKLNDELEKQISKKVPEFTLAAKHEFNQKPIDYTLHFKAGDTDEMYFFNKFDAKLQAGKDQQVNQTFYINRGNGITAKEAFNLMEGRAVYKLLFNKESEKYHAWLQLDPEKLTENGNKEIKRFNENYGFDLEKVLSGKGIKEMENPESKENLLRSLHKGNAQQVTVTKGNEEVKYFVTASPQYKTIDLYDHQMKRIKREELLQQTPKSSKDKKQNQQQKEGLSEKKQPSKKRKVTV